MRFTVDDLKKASNAEIKGALDGDFEISTDTRTIKKGDLYLPLKGANFDGENFCDKAIEAGAAGCFCTKDACPAAFKLKVCVHSQMDCRERQDYNKRDGIFSYFRKI